MTDEQTYEHGLVDVDAILRSIANDEPLPTYEQTFPTRAHVKLDPPEWHAGQ